ncbi:MAG: sodium:proton antiporter [Victivallales bacterium]|nr:sodium:proton antiporter [Victivallales bacterium]
MEAGGYFVPHIMTLIVLFFIAACSGILLKKLKFPFTIGLVVIGIVFAGIVENVEVFRVAEDISLSHDIIFFIILPTLIFEAAVNIDSRLLVKNLPPVCILAIPGLIISTVIIGIFMTSFTPLLLGPAMLFGALISATDPVAVIALFKEIGAPRRLTMLVDGESLFNDATAIVVFNIIMAVVASGIALNLETLASAVLSFLYVFFGGLFVGLFIGFFITKFINLSKGQPLIQVALSTITAYAAFVIAEHYLKVSGVMSTLAAGLTVSWYGSTSFSTEVKEYMEQFWEFAAFAANSFIFLLLGVSEWRLLIGHGHSDYLALYLLITIAIVTFARAVVVYGLIPLLKLLPKYERINKNYQTVIFWGGLRGAVPLALVLSLSPVFKNHQYITEYTLGVVLFTLLIQGTTTKPLMSFLGLNRKSLFDKILFLRGKLEAISRAKQIIMKLTGQSYLQKKVLFGAKKEYDIREKETIRRLNELQKNSSFNIETSRKLLWFQAISFEQKAYNLLFRKGLISESMIRELTLNIEYERDKVRQGVFPEVNISAVPLEIRIRNFFIGAAKIVLPKNEFIKLLREKTLSAKYELTLAMITANNHISSEISKMPQFYGRHSSIVKECRDFYKERANLAIQQRRKQEKYHKILDLQSSTVYRAALNAEMEAVEQLSSNGNIPDNVKNMLKSEIEKNISVM